MVYAAKEYSDEEMFLAILEASKKTLIAVLRESRSLPNASQFESMVCEHVAAASVGTEFEGTIKQTSTAAFPDIAARGYFGIEVKMTIKDHWRSVGNSVLESLREPGMERIYIMFGKLGGVPDVTYRLYQDCIPSVSVTHSPRYQIDMNLKEGNSIFDKMGTSYDELRNHSDTIRQIKSYYRSQLGKGEALWWIDRESETAVPIIKQYKSLSQHEKDQFKVDCLILFSELFKRKASYDRAAAYLIAEYGAVSSSLRDCFTAGGQKIVRARGVEQSVSQLQSQLFGYASHIRSRIDEIDEEVLKFYWNTSRIETNRLAQWKRHVDGGVQTSEEPKPSAILEAGLQA